MFQESCPATRDCGVIATIRHIEPRLNVDRHKPHKMTAQLIDEIDDKLYLKWGSEQISGWLLVEQNFA